MSNEDYLHHREKPLRLKNKKGEILYPNPSDIYKVSKGNDKLLYHSDYDGILTDPDSLRTGIIFLEQFGFHHTHHVNLLNINRPDAKFDGKRVYFRNGDYGRITDQYLQYLKKIGFFKKK
ncbi:hypothetical protein [Chengkuizengella axinellae]|uniref:HTH LytTR-type domain-containing protein n=1 Tax=Chengkuizengella axinellae TaxID=3064388 RepID=A0ABT9J0U1_9BACL|nr:hypothetical protein [Chengkuizengella sp. 2205SS18-9]MDP5275246.1 hypothetical protein [Chengkuizengella sp. 2205SS18-9]